MQPNKEELQENFLKNFNQKEEQETTSDLIYEDQQFQIPIGLKDNLLKIWDLFIQCIPQITTLLTIGYFILTNMIVLRILGKDELIASYGIGQTWANLVMVSPIVSIGVGLLSPASQAYGSQNFKKFGILLNQGYLFAFTIVLFSFLVFVLNTPWFLFKLGVQESIAKQAQLYLLSSMPAYIFQVLYDVKRFWLFSQQKANIPKTASIIGMSLNPIWLYIFVYYLDLELVGIGITRFITFFILFLIQEILIRKKEPEVVKLIRVFNFKQCLQEDYKEFVKFVSSVGLIGIIPWLNQECSTVVVANLQSIPEIAAHTTLLAVTPLTQFFMIGSGQSASLEIQQDKEIYQKQDILIMQE